LLFATFVSSHVLHVFFKASLTFFFSGKIKKNLKPRATAVSSKIFEIIETRYKKRDDDDTDVNDGESLSSSPTRR
jgi:hypothetical protein